MKLHRLRGLLLNYYYFSLNSIDRIFDLFYWPVLDLFIWGFITIYISGISEYNVINTILGGLILWVFAWRTSTDLVVYLLESYWSRSTYHLFATPVKVTEIMGSLMILGLIRSCIAFLVLIGLATLIYGFDIMAFNLTALAVLTTLLILVSWGIGLFVASFIFRFGTRMQVLAWSVIWIIQPFSCVFYPLSALPSWAQSIARINPLTQVFEQLRATLAGTPLDWYGLSYAFVGALVIIAIGAFAVSRGIAKARKNGSFAKPE